MQKSILVTGGAGYIGSHTCKFLYSKGLLPITYDNLTQGRREAVKWGPLVIGDLFDRNLLAQVFDRYQPLAVIHFAAYSHLSESIADPGKYYTNNVAGTLCLLEAMRSAGCKNIVFSSTCSTYGIPQKLPIDESCPLGPINPYGWSKLMVEQILADFAAAHGTKYIALRYFNAAGADPAGEIGENHSPETHLIPSTILAALQKRPGVEVYGTDYPTADGTAVRDFIHVNDLADAHLRALDFLAREQRSEVINLGTGQGLSVQKIIDTVARISGRHFPVTYRDRRPGDPPTLVASANRAEKLLGWQPRFTDIETIISTAWRYHCAAEQVAPTPQ